MAGGGSLAAAAGEKLATTKRLVTTTEPLTPFADVTDYNNFFGTGKRDPAKHAGSLKTRPWSVAVEGEVRRPAVYALEDLLQPHPLEERLYRLRRDPWSCHGLIFRSPTSSSVCNPTSRAKYVELITLHDPKQMPGQHRVAGVCRDFRVAPGLPVVVADKPIASSTFG